MINDHERNILKMQDQIDELSRLLLSDWQTLELHRVEEEIFRTLLTHFPQVSVAILPAWVVASSSLGESIRCSPWQSLQVGLSPTPAISASPWIDLS